MRFCSHRTGGRLAAGALVLLAFAARGEKVWISPVDGLWSQGTNWSGGTPPDSTSFIQITNPSSKTVTIDALTDPANLTVQKLTVSAPPGATNTVLLTDAGAANPLILQTGLELDDGAWLRITNSAVLLQLTNDRVNLDGWLTLDSGSLDFGDTTVTARVGRATSGVMTINGGQVSAGTITVGGLTNSQGTLNLNGGTLNVALLLSVGRNPGTTGSVFVAGGQLIAPGADTRVGDSGSGQLVISNATANLAELGVGRDPDSWGTMTLQTGANILVASNVSVARFGGSTGILQIAGGQLSVGSDKIDLAPEGSGQMSVTGGSVQAADLLVAAAPTNTASATLAIAGGLLNLSSSLVVGAASFSAGQVMANGGAVVVTNPAGTATTWVANGSLVLGGANWTTDALVVTNASGQFSINSGTVRSKSTTVANGLPFVVGDGVNSATLHLDGGTHIFASGLVISSMATLEGCGTVIGTIINHGIIATNCNVTTPPAFTFRPGGQAGATNRFLVNSAAGVTYTLEFKNSLGDPSWTVVLPPLAGTGGVITLTDTNATVPTRFYRVLAQ